MKKRMLKTIFTLMLALIFIGISACKPGIDPDNPQKLEIYVYNAGYGYKWAEEILEAFKQEPWVKEKYPDLRTSFEKDELATRASELLGASRNVNKYEVIMGTSLERQLGPNRTVTDLTESVYNSMVPGEEILFKDKMIPSYLQSSAYITGNVSSEPRSYYQVNWASGMTGVIYNADKLKALGKNVPNTTDEFVKIMQDVKSLNGSHSDYKETYSFVTYGASGYVSYLYYTWWSQYQTAEEYVNFYSGIDSETNSRSPAVFSQTGLLKSLEVLESFLHRDTNYTWVNPNTGREAYRETQNKVLLGTALFMANGDWVDNELRELYQGLKEINGHADTVKMMRTPIISSIIEKTPTINDDITLSNVISAIDNGETDYPNISSEDFETILAARQVVYTIGPGHNAVIPEYAAGKEVAIDFMRYLATDKANEIYIRNTNGASLPFVYDLRIKNQELFNQISPMQQDRLDYFTSLNVNVLPSQNSFPLVRYGGLSLMASGNPMTAFTGAASKGNFSSLAEMLHKRELTYWTESNNARWLNALAQAGL